MAEILWQPNDGPQTAFLSSVAREVMYGGAVGGGKTDALLALALRWVDHPKHRAMILRRTRPNLQEVIDRALQLYKPAVPGAKWKESESRWVFPSGAVIQMGYAENEKDILNFKSFEYNLICFDELTSFTEYMYNFMFTRNRTKSDDLPLMMRSGTNPGDVGHDFVLKRFIGSKAGNDLREPHKIYTEYIDIELDGKQLKVPVSRQFIPSRVQDNPRMPNRAEYIAGIMASMTPEDQAAYLEGRWDALSGAMFKKPLIVLDQCSMLDTDYITVRSIDWGIDDPTCVLWGIFYPKANVLDVVSELYVKETSMDGIVHYIKEREAALRLRPVLYSVGSPEMLNRQSTSQDLQSIASMLTAKGVPVVKANVDRMAGWSKLIDLTGKAGLRIWPAGDGVHGAPNLIRTLPKLQRNTGPGKDPNDLRPRQEDHAADSLRYMAMAMHEVPAVMAAPVIQAERDPAQFDTTFDKVVGDRRKVQQSNYFEGFGEWD